MWVFVANSRPITGVTLSRPRFYLRNVLDVMKAKEVRPSSLAHGPYPPSIGTVVLMLSHCMQTNTPGNT